MNEKVPYRHPSTPRSIRFPPGSKNRPAPRHHLTFGDPIARAVKVRKGLDRFLEKQAARFAEYESPECERMYAAYIGGGQR